MKTDGKILIFYIIYILSVGMIILCPKPARGTPLRKLPSQSLSCCRRHLGHSPLMTNESEWGV